MLRPGADRPSDGVWPRGARAPVSRPSSERPSLVLLPGTLCDERLFAPCLKRLRRALPHWDVRVIDFGGLEAGPSTWARRVWAGLPHQTCLLGFSLGGIAAVQLMREAPHRALAVALVASTAESGSRRGQMRARRQWGRWMSGGPAGVVRGLMPAYFSQGRSRARHASTLGRMADDTAGDLARAQFDWAARRAAGHEVLASHEAPLLIVSGQCDGLCPRPTQRRILRSRPDASWIEMRHAGHFLPLERPAALARHVACWLNHHFPRDRGES